MDRVVLNWEKPKSDGGAPITGYVVEKKEKRVSTWEEVLTTNVSENIFTSYYFVPPAKQSSLSYLN